MKLAVGKVLQKGIGLDIGFHSIKAVELVPSDKGFDIAHYCVREIPRAVLNQKDRIAPLANIIKKMFAEAGIKNRKVYLSVTGHNVIIRKTTLPKMPLEELPSAIRWNAKEDILFNVDEAVVDYHITSETSENGGEFYELLTVIVRADIIPYLMNIANAAGLQVMGVNIVPVALWDYDKALHPTQPGVVTSYVDMGAERTRIYFVCDEQLLFSREIPSGGNNITETLEGEYALPNGETMIIDAERAEQIKRTFGLPAEDASGTTEEGIPLASIRERIMPILSRQVEEFRRSIDYFKNQYKKDAVSRMILSGGAVCLSGLYQFLNDNLSLEIDRCNPLFQTSSELSAEKEERKLLGPSLTVAAGLALGQCDKINLLPDEYKITLKKTLLKWAPYSVILLLIAGFFGLGMHFRGKVSDEENRLEKRKQDLVELQSRLVQLQQPGADLAALKEEKKQLEDEKKQLPSAKSFPVDFGETFAEFARVVDAHTALSGISYVEAVPGGKGSEAGGRLSVKGHIFGDEMSTQRSLRMLLENLDGSAAFKDVQLVQSKPLDKGAYTSPGIDFEVSLAPAVKGA